MAQKGKSRQPKNPLYIMTHTHTLLFGFLFIVSFFLLYLSVSDCKIPVLCSDTGKSYTRAIAGTLLSSTFVALFFDLITRGRFNKSIQDNIRSVMYLENRNLPEAGVLKCFPNLSIEKLQDRIRNAHHEIIISKIWIEHFEDYAPELRDALKRNVKVKLLIVENDESAVFTKRSLSTCQHHNDVSYVDRVNSSKKELVSFRNSLKQNELKKNLEMKQHSGFISIPFIRIDNISLFGLYLYGRFSNKGTWFEIDNNKLVGSDLTNHWNELWKTGKPI